MVITNIDDTNIMVIAYVNVVVKRADTSMPISKVIIASIKANINILETK